MVGPMAEKFVWFLFPVFISITKFSDFLVMSYGNWKHILGVFSFHNSVFNGISVIKHTMRGPLIRSTATFDPFFFSLFSMSFPFTLASSSSSFSFSFHTSFFFFFFFPFLFTGFLGSLFFFSSFFFLSSLLTIFSLTQTHKHAHPHKPTK